ncbi:MAG: S-layer homology domain-containing protein [Acidimicrobiaceae bacterium]|nr:S-layer homology domain-containing protein [Acidimicrobiaceae bacterium]
MPAIIVAVVAAVLATAGTVIAQSTQRFPDVPPDHEAFEAIEWAAEVGITIGYTDGTFKPERPLNKTHAVVFMERYYDQILQASESPEFTRGDMMQVLYEVAGAPGRGSSSSDSGEGAGDTGEEAPSGTPWLGTSTFDGESSGVVCGRGPAEFTWDLDAQDQNIRYLTVLIWSPPDRRVEINVTGPNGATENLGGWHGDSRLLSFGDDAQAHIDAGETSLSITPMMTWEERREAGRTHGDYGQQPAPNAVWGVAGFATNHSYLSTSSKLRQQWALSVNCDRTE